MFHFDYADNGYYNYYLKMPGKTSPDDVMYAIQRELETAFGFDAAVEEIQMPIIILKATPGAIRRLSTKGGAPYRSSFDTADSFAGFTVRNLPISDVINMATEYVWYKIPPIVDETAFEGNIDISIDAVLSDFGQIKKELERNGIKVIYDKRVMKVLVIRDAENE